MSRKSVIVVALVLIAGGALMFAVGTGSDPDAVPSSHEVARRTMSPYCEGLTLQECPTSQSRELRGLISQKVAAGWTNREIDQWLVDNYGPAVLGTGGSAARIIPVAALVLGTLIVLAVIRSKARPAKLAEEPEDITPQHLSQVRAELRTFEHEDTE